MRSCDFAGLGILYIWRCEGKIMMVVGGRSLDDASRSLWLCSVLFFSLSDLRIYTPYRAVFFFSFPVLWVRRAFVFIDYYVFVWIVSCSFLVLSGTRR